VYTPSTGNQPQAASTYDVSLIIPCSSYLPFTLDTIEVIESQLFLPQGFHVLIARDVLKHCHFAYNGRAEYFTLAY